MALTFQERVNRAEASYSNFVLKFGRKTGVGATPLILYSGGTPYTGWLSPENNVIAVSASADDKSGSGGAVVITVIGQGDNGIEITEDITLDGTDPSVATVNKFAIVYRAFVKTTEDIDPILGPNHGTISIYESGTPLNICAYIDEHVLGTTIGAGQTTMCIYRIPINKYGEFLSIGLYVDAGKSGIIVAKTRTSITAPWLTKATFSIFQGSIIENNISPGFIAPGSDIILLVVSSASGTSIDGSFELKLKDLPE